MPPRSNITNKCSSTLHVASCKLQPIEEVPFWSLLNAHTPTTAVVTQAITNSPSEGITLFSKCLTSLIFTGL